MRKAGNVIIYDNCHQVETPQEVHFIARGEEANLRVLCITCSVAERK